MPTLREEARAAFLDQLEHAAFKHGERSGQVDEALVQFSIAISLRRIADLMEKFYATGAKL